MRFPYHGAGIGLVKDGCLLMGRRSDTPFYGRWAVPGGGRDKADSDEFATAVREFREETSVDFQSLKTVFICKWTLKVPFFSWSTYFYSVDSFDYEPHSDEFSEFEWVSLERLTGKGKGRKKHLRPFTRSEVRLLQENLS